MSQQTTTPSLGAMDSWSDGALGPRAPGDLAAEIEGPRADPLSEILCLQAAIVHGRPALRAMWSTGLRPRHLRIIDHVEALGALYKATADAPDRFDRGVRARIELVKELVPAVPRWRLDSIARSATVARETGEHAASYAERVIAFDAVARAEGPLRAALWALEDADGPAALDQLREAARVAGLLEEDQ